MGRVLNIPEDIVSYFYTALKEKGKYRVEHENNSVVIYPRENQEYYKPPIIIRDVGKLEEALKNYATKLDSFYSKNYKLEEYQDLSYFLTIMLFNMTNSDAEDLVHYINQCSLSFERDIFDDFEERQKVIQIDDSEFYAQRFVESPGLETPYYMLFQMERGSNVYELPLVRYTIRNDVCYIYAVQMGRGRSYNYQEKDYKEVINKANSGLKEDRDIPPNFALVLALFIKTLRDHNISRIMIPDYLFGRYRNYHRSTTITKSDELLERIMNRFLQLIRRIDAQIDGLDITSYPNDIDSYMRININSLSSKNTMFNDIFTDKSHK